MAIQRTALTLALSALSLAGCATDVQDYPSLARRPIERVTGTAPVAAPTEAPPAPLDAAVLGKLDSLVAQARAADRRFHDKQPRARALVSAAAGSAVANEAWSVASVALSELESARSDAFVAMAELDALYARAVVDRVDTGDIAAARGTVQVILTDQGKIIDELHARLR